MWISTVLRTCRCRVLFRVLFYSPPSTSNPFQGLSHFSFFIESCSFLLTFIFTQNCVAINKQNIYVLSSGIHWWRCYCLLLFEAHPEQASKFTRGDACPPTWFLKCALYFTMQPSCVSKLLWWANMCDTVISMHFVCVYMVVYLLCTQAVMCLLDVLLC